MRTEIRTLAKALRKGLAATLMLTMVAGGLLPAEQAQAAAGKTIVYDEQLREGFVNYSWATVNLKETKTVHSGKYSIMMNPSNDGGLYLYKDRVQKVTDGPELSFWIHGGTTGGQKLRLVLNSGGGQVAEQPLDALLPDGKLTAGKWQQAKLNLAEVNIPNGIFDGILLQDTSGAAQKPIYIDDMLLAQGSAPEQPPARKMTAIGVQPDALTVKAGESSAVRAEARYSDGTAEPAGGPVAWASGNPAVAGVSAQGAVIGINAGTSVVTATYQGFTASVNVTVTAVPTPPPPPPPPDPQPIPEVAGYKVYDEQINSPFEDYSWAQRNMAQSGIVHSGTKAIEMNPGNGAALYLYKGDGPVLASKHDRLEFWVNGGAAGSQKLELTLNAGGVGVATLDVASLVPGGAIPANSWVKAEVKLPDLKLPGGLFDAIVIKGSTDGEQPNVFIDDINVLEVYVEPAKVTETVLSVYQMVLLPGDSSQLELTANYSDGTEKVVNDKAVWTVDDPSIISAAGGKLTALKPGIAKVTGAFGGKSSSMYVQVTTAVPVKVYDDALVSGYGNWSWGTQDLNGSAQVHSGSRSVSFLATGYEGLWFHNNNGAYEANEFYGMEMWVHGGATGGQKLKMLVMDGRSVIGDFALEPVPANQWKKVTVKLADLGIGTATFDGIGVQAWGEENQGYVYIDDISLLKNANVVKLPDPDLPRVAVQIDINADKKPVSRDIFGVNFEERPSEDASQMKFPLVRWGGNQMSRYNWELDVTNRAGDWYFLNLTNDTPDPAKLPYGSLSDRFIEKSIVDQSKVLLQVPTIGWTPKSRDVTWSFSINKYGAQSGNECDWGEAWCRKDAGNGFQRDGLTYKTGNDPTDTAKPFDSSFVGRWIDHLHKYYGNFVRHYALDNEPALWGHTHRDIHPQMTTYDEIWNYTKDYGTVIKTKDPQSVVYGPVSWGWCEYFYSAKDGCFPGDDMKAHGDKPFLEWYLGRLNEHKQQTGTSLVDVLDIHYYPAENGIAFTSDESKETTKRRLSSLKSLFDPAYQDPTSWIQEPVRLIPRMKELIAQNNPGMKLAITEYNFGDGGGIGSGLAQAEALALFAREGVDLATRWGGLQAGTPLEDAYKLYLNYDGKGNGVQGDIVRTTSSNFDAVGAYTVRSGSKTYMLLFNKDTAPRTADVAINSEFSGSAQVYRFDGKQRLQQQPSMQTSGNSLSVTLPARSATLIVSGN
jgi:hypothetical protein